MPNNNSSELKRLLDNAEKIAVLGIGSDLVADDAAGILVAKALEKHQGRKLKVFLGYSAPENLTGEIIKFKPSHIVIVDSADFKKEAGYTAIIDLKDIGGTSFSTHRLPTKIIADYLVQSCGAKIVIIGIQPKTLDFGRPPSMLIKKVVRKLVSDILDGGCLLGKLPAINPK